MRLQVVSALANVNLCLCCQRPKSKPRTFGGDRRRGDIELPERSNNFAVDGVDNGDQRFGIDTRWEQPLNTGVVTLTTSGISGLPSMSKMFAVLWRTHSTDQPHNPFRCSLFFDGLMTPVVPTLRKHHRSVGFRRNASSLIRSVVICSGYSPDLPAKTGKELRPTV